MPISPQRNVFKSLLSTASNYINPVTFYLVPYSLWCTCIVSSFVSFILFQGSHSTWKTGKMVKSFSRQGKHREFLNFGKTQGIWNLTREIQYQDNNSRKDCCVISMKWHLTFKMVKFYHRNTQGKLKLCRENTGKTQGILFSMMSGNNIFAKHKFLLSPCITMSVSYIGHTHGIVFPFVAERFKKSMNKASWLLQCEQVCVPGVYENTFKVQWLI